MTGDVPRIKFVVEPISDRVPVTPLPTELLDRLHEVENKLNDALVQIAQRHSDI